MIVFVKSVCLTQAYGPAILADMAFFCRLPWRWQPYCCSQRAQQHSHFSLELALHLWVCSCFTRLELDAGSHSAIQIFIQRNELCLANWHSCVCLIYNHYAWQKCTYCKVYESVRVTSSIPILFKAGIGYQQCMIYFDGCVQAT